MPHPKYTVGERVEMLCQHLRDGRRVQDWLAGTVIEVDERMAAVKFDVPVFANPGWPIPDGVLWAAHGSRHLRRRGASGGPQA